MWSCDMTHIYLPSSARKQSDTVSPESHLRGIVPEISPIETHDVLWNICFRFLPHSTHLPRVATIHHHHLWTRHNFCSCSSHQKTNPAYVKTSRSWKSQYFSSSSSFAVSSPLCLVGESEVVRRVVRPDSPQRSPFSVRVVVTVCC